MTRFFLYLGIVATFAILGQPAFAGTEGMYRGETVSGRVPTFTLDQAILTALQRNPTLLNAEQEIKRTKGVIIQVRAQALPQINANANFQWIDPHLIGARVFGNTSTTSGFTPSPAASRRRIPDGRTVVAGRRCSHTTGCSNASAIQEC